MTAFEKYNSQENYKNLASVYKEPDNYRAFIEDTFFGGNKWYEVNFKRLLNDTKKIHREVLDNIVVRNKYNLYSIDYDNLPQDLDEILFNEKTTLDEVHYFMSYLNSRKNEDKKTHDKLLKLYDDFVKNYEEFNKPLIEGPFDKSKIVIIYNKLLGTDKLTLNQSLDQDLVSEIPEYTYVKVLNNAYHFCILQDFVQNLHELDKNDKELKNKLDNWVEIFIELCCKFGRKYTSSYIYPSKYINDDDVCDLFDIMLCELNFLELKTKDSHVDEWVELINKLRYWSTFLEYNKF